jgi:DHA2 family methylenomycin A resistance protein-like MFS transporter
MSVSPSMPVHDSRRTFRPEPKDQVATLSCVSEPTSVRPAGHGAVSSPRVVLVVMCAGYFLVLLDVTVVNVALPQIGSDLDASVSGLQWVVDGYAIALASLMLGAGTVGDIGGHKRVVLWGLAVFGLASLGCGLAPTTGVLVGFRVLQGIGAALLLPGTVAVISHAFPEPGERTRAIGVWAGIGSAALPALLLWGSGLGILTPAVVAAAIGAVGSQRAGLASAVNNTARQAGGAIGIAAFGALAGQPGTPRFISGFHTAALIAAVLLAAVTVATLALVPAARSS